MFFDFRLQHLHCKTDSKQALFSIGTDMKRTSSIFSPCLLHLNFAKAFTNDPLNGDNKYTASDICKMTEFLVDNIYIRFGGQLFRQTVGIPMGTNCAPLLADLFIYSYENEFSDKLIKEGRKSLLESSISHIVILAAVTLGVPMLFSL